MKALRDALDKVHPLFAKGGPLQIAYPMYEALDTFLYTPGEVAHGKTHVRDTIDLKRMMITVVMALVPATIFGMWNVGYQANLAIQHAAEAGELYQGGLYFDFHHWLGFTNDPTNITDCFFLGAIHFLPMYIVCMFVGGHIELVFSVLRGHEINEGFLVTGLLFPLTLPASIPLWQVAVGIAFGVIVAKEVFGGTGRNFLNVALTSRAFLYFAYAGQISGDKVWTAVDGFSGATALGQMAAATPDPTGETNAALSALQGVNYALGQADPVTWTEPITLSSAFLGTIQGCVGETSTLMCLIGAAILIGTGIGSWKIMAGVLAGVAGTSLFLNGVSGHTNPMMDVPFYWHYVVGGLAFGLVFMATDPVSASMTETGKWIYGGLIGFMTVLIRCINPAFPEGIMLAILFGNVFAPLIDYFVVSMNVRRRMARYAAT
ncbi:NADH:ubiquinone reductase (Na(+)-transporting) subunit B [Rhodopirellula sp. MGV]|uniref:NADH:ubiquinone reductase (Na(+)-transporting) subunit B n=1 Tax=Rhodopirellula sp. MGV TaxID=2023130 RepID=UPI000B972ECA|nr:NADH:ubiquinone reductase (Na(+)-transporting) subunit B [Rhodopirellula sp. MGV]OYP33148.1 NADH:ubiquinone reductase (Na(+)-transporting) subunit B [Rhodopirellula sp. MGV]PNY35123.1 NADH:ubiquinone reductase (Na(+)-transporting) subunit B [Rhodopirellula baltica]